MKEHLPSGKLALGAACGQTHHGREFAFWQTGFQRCVRANTNLCEHLFSAKPAISAACRRTNLREHVPSGKLAFGGASGTSRFRILTIRVCPPQECASMCSLAGWLLAARMELPDSAFSPFGCALRRSARAFALWQAGFRRREWNFQIPHSHHSGMPSAGAREHVLSGKLTFGGASGTSRFHIPAIRVCPPQECAGMCSLAN